MIEILNLQHAFDRHNIEQIKKLSYNAYLCKQKDGRLVVLKAGDRVTFERNTRTKNILTFLESHPFKNALVPQFVGMSVREDENQYIITTFQEASEPQWSEFDGNEKLGGKLISLEYVDSVISAAEDLFACPVSEINFLTPGTNSLDSVSVFVKSLYERGVLKAEAFQEIEKIIESQKDEYFSKNTTISNGDFYPRNLLITDTKKPYLIDWDGAHLTTREQVLMYFWATMFGNLEFQGKILEYCQNRPDWNRERYVVGLLQSVCEDLSTWIDNPKCSEASKAYLNYLNNIQNIF